jgi:hypothetical protein
MAVASGEAAVLLVPVVLVVLPVVVPVLVVLVVLPVVLLVLVLVLCCWWVGSGAGVLGGGSGRQKRLTGENLSQAG